MPNISATAKAYIALIGALATGLLGVFAADTDVGKVLVAITIVATGFITWRVPNTEKPKPEPLQ